MAERLQDDKLNLVHSKLEGKVDHEKLTQVEADLRNHLAQLNQQVTEVHAKVEALPAALPAAALAAAPEAAAVAQVAAAADLHQQPVAAAASGPAVMMPVAAEQLSASAPPGGHERAEQLHVEVQKIQERHDEHAGTVAKSMQEFEDKIQTISTQANASKNEYDQMVQKLHQLETELKSVDAFLMAGSVKMMEEQLQGAFDRISAIESRQSQMSAGITEFKGKQPTFDVKSLNFDELVAQKPLADMPLDLDIGRPLASGEDKTPVPPVAEETEASGELKPFSLDRSECYPLCESLWETCIFFGHPAVGWDVSLVVAFGVLINTVVQVGFTLFVSQTMTDDPVSSEQLDGLLRFRASIAHNAKWADHSTHRSMASQLCDTDDRLPLAGGQMGLYADIQDFLANAHPLCVLANLCWIAIIIRELLSSLKYAAAVRGIPRGPLTISATGGGGAEPYCGVKIESISLARVIFLHICVVIPRVGIALFLGWTGIEFLTVTANMGDLLLNAMALAFVIDIDCLFFSIFAPSRIKSLVGLTEPLPIIYRPMCCNIGSTLIAVTVLVGVMTAVETEFLGPFFKRLEQAKDIMCSGNTDFIAAMNPATGIMHITRSSPDLSTWTPHEYHVLQAAHPYIHDVRGWHVPETLAHYASTNFTEAKITWSYGHAELITEAAYSQVDFEAVFKMDSATTVQAAETLVCQDEVSGQSHDALVNHLQHLLGNESVHGCDPEDEWMVELCGLENMSMLRAVCPITCGCHNLMAGQLGFFGGPHWGCPVHCTSLMTAYSEFALKEGFYTPCEDHSEADWLGEAYHPMLVKYFEGIYEFLHHMWDEFKSMLKHTVEEHGLDAFGLPEEVHEDFQKKILSGEILELAFGGEWEIFEGYKHPRGLVGCEFWASWEIQLIFGLDFCHVGEFRSLRFFCPESCHCDKTSPECPLSCSKDSDALPAYEGLPGSHGGGAATPHNSTTRLLAMAPVAALKRRSRTRLPGEASVDSSS
eukprot:TRINITY_DN10469_c0_g3_i1.p1 TRINITY_DN10469_c0_g3~~TRINITY_DN10469_c0_g3_i1.p1  ORF type:complete len:991 (-),score=239.21 TRINITY_DN10469_c0_g3_i1:504-3476(-)